MTSTLTSQGNFRSSFNQLKEANSSNFPAVHSRFESRCQDLEDKLRQVKKSEENISKNITETLHKLTQILKNQKTTREITEEKKQRELKTAESSLTLEVI